MRTVRKIWRALLITTACVAAQAADLTLEGNRLVVSGMLDGTAAQVFLEQVRRGSVQTVIFEDSLGGSADVAVLYAQAIRETGVNTEVVGQCHAACAYAYLAGKVHRFGEGEQVNALLIPVGTRPKPAELASRWRGDQAHRTLAEFTEPTQDGEIVNATDAPAKEKWQPEHGVLFTATPTLFGRVYNTYYCDGSQGRDFTRCELLSDADPRKLGVISE
jgi:hypothetical protein